MTELFTQLAIPLRTWNETIAMGATEGNPQGADQASGGLYIGGRYVGGTTEGASYRSSISGARFEILPETDPTIGCVAYDAAGTEVFKVLVTGTDKGDVIIGNYSGGQGAKWDDSAGTFVISGALNASSINIPDTTTVNSFHADSSGNTWWGATVIGSATAKVLNTGAATFTNIVLTGLQAGSSIDGQFLAALSVSSAAIAASAITTAKIAADAVTAGEIAAGAVTTAKIAALAVTATEIATGAVITAKIAADAVTAAEIAASAVGSDQLAAGSVIAGKIAALTIVAADIAAGTITGAKIAATTITASNIAALTITAAEIAASTITGAKIAAGTITAANITALTITAAEIAAGTITGAKIAAITIAASNIVAGTITTAQIAANTIVAGNMNVAQLSAISANLGTITAGSISIVAGANTIGLTPSGTNAIFSGTTGSPEFKVTPAGVMTATGANISGTITGSTITGSTITTGTVGANVNIELSRLAIRTGITEVLGLELGSTSGTLFINETDGVNRFQMFYSAGQMRLIGFGTSTDFNIAPVRDLYITLGAGRFVLPSTDNSFSFGATSNRWADVRSVLINGADICLENGWKFREYPAKKEDVGKPVEWMRKNANKGIQLLDDNEKVIAVFTRDGIYGDFRPLKDLENSI